MFVKTERLEVLRTQNHLSQKDSSFCTESSITIYTVECTKQKKIFFSATVMIWMTALDKLNERTAAPHHTFYNTLTGTNSTVEENG